MSQLFYRGPAMTHLRGLAAEGRIDEQAPVQGRAERLVKATPQDVWAVLSDLDRWPEIVPSVSRMQRDGELSPDSSFTWTNSGMTIKSQVVTVVPSQELSWTGVAFGVRAVHRNTLQAVEEGTLLRSEESMAFPMLSLLFPAKKLTAGLEEFVAAFARAAESRAESPR